MVSERALGRVELFRVFLRAGLAFGGGLGILAVLEDELVTRRRLLSREEFLTIYALARAVPAGASTALAVAFGHQFGGWPGTAIALVGLVAPALVCTVALTAAYSALHASALFGWLGVTLLPAALGFIVLAALRLARGLGHRSLDLALTVAVFVGAVGFDVNPGLLLVATGVVGAVWLRPAPEADR